MHLDNGSVTPTCAALGMAAAAGGWGMALSMFRRSSVPKASAFAAATALVFALQAFNVPIMPQVSGHFIGGFLLAWWFGPGWGLAGMTLVLIAQTLLFADGGLLTLGLNVLTMGIVPCLLVYPAVRHTLAGKSPLLAAGVGAWVSVILAALICGLALASVSGLSSTWLGAMGTLLGVHALIGVIELVLTVSAILVVRQLSETHLRLTAPLSVTVLAIAAGFGASPWPDGLEYAIHLHGLEEAVAGVIEHVAALQGTIAVFEDYTAMSTLVGSVVVGVLSILMVASSAKLKARFA